MITRKQYRTIQKLKPIAIATIPVASLITLNIIAHNISDKQLQQEAQAYKQCNKKTIQNNSKTKTNTNSYNNCSITNNNQLSSTQHIR